MNKHLSIIFARAAELGLNQKTLAKAVGTPEETLSRLKNKDSIRTDVLERLARIVGIELKLSLIENGPSKATPAPIDNNSKQPQGFREKYKKLVWSNPQAAPEVFVRQALVKPDFDVLLDAALEFGLPMVQEQWRELEEDPSKEVLRAAPTTRRMLRHITHGYEQATA